ncbi:MAG: glycine zipper 2TM domain-containing protein [Hyphomonadaceae bacterium]
MRGKVLLALGATMTMLAFAQPAQAQYYDDGASYAQHCEQQRRDRTVGGAVIGAIIGGVIGNNVAATGNQSEGTILGGVLGGAAGAAIGRGTANRCGPAEGDAYYPAEDYPDDGYPEELAGGPYGDPRMDGECAWRDHSFYDERGRWRREQVYMCRDEYGEWRRAD